MTRAIELSFLIWFGVCDKAWVTLAERLLIRILERDFFRTLVLCFLSFLIPPFAKAGNLAIIPRCTCASSLKPTLVVMTQPWNLAQSNYSVVKDHHYEVAVLPFGATEPHNLHLPYSTDTLEATIIGEHICRAAHLKGAEVVLLPAIPYGTETNMREFPLAMNLNPSTMTMIVADLLETLIYNEIYKIVLLNSHGGNAFKPILRELSAESEAHLFLCDWYQTIDDIYYDIFDKGEDHAGEMETSFALAYFPDLVATDANGKLRADDGEVRASRFRALNEGWISITRPWHLLTKNSGAADPHWATAEKGVKLMDVLMDRLSEFLVELSQSQIDDEFPY